MIYSLEVEAWVGMGTSLENFLEERRESAENHSVSLNCPAVAGHEGHIRKVPVD